MSTQKQIMDDIARARRVVEKSDALKQLEQTGAYRKVFTEGLFKDELTRCVLERHSASAERKEALTDIADAISYLHMHLSSIHLRADVARINIREGLGLLDETEED